MLNKKHGYMLAEISQFGCVFDCGNCGNIHVTIGPVSLMLAPGDYMKLVTMIHSSAAGFETWLEAKRCDTEHRSDCREAGSDTDAEEI